MPHSQVASQTGMLEKEIYTQIGVPNSKVMSQVHFSNKKKTKYSQALKTRQAPEYWLTIVQVSVSMQPYVYADTTYVKFGVLPDPRNTSMSTESIDALRASLIKLTLQQLNLSLTPSVFGDTFCLEILGFPGGITVLLPHSAPHADLREPLFNVTFNSTIHEIRGVLEEMKIELGSTLEQTPDEVTDSIPSHPLESPVH